MTSYRSRLKIVADVLSVAKGGAKKTQIMYQANLSYKLLTRYLQEVLEAGLVKLENGEAYELTAKGFEFLREFDDYYERRQKLRTQATEMKRRREVLENSFLNNATAGRSGSKSTRQMESE